MSCRPFPRSKTLDKINEELDLEDEIVEARSIELTPEQDAAEADAEDASLDEVTDQGQRDPGKHQKYVSPGDTLIQVRYGRLGRTR